MSEHDHLDEDNEAELMVLIRRGVVALEAIAASLPPARLESRPELSAEPDNDRDARDDPGPMADEHESAPPSVPVRRTGTVVDLPVVHRNRGSSNGVSNLLYYTAAPTIVRRLLRDDRAIRDGVLTTTLDAAAELGRESRTRVLARMRTEGLITLSDTKKGQPAMVRVADADRARAWVESLSRSDAAP